MNTRIQVQISGETWKRLNQLREPGDSLNDVIARSIKPKTSDDKVK